MSITTRELELIVEKLLIEGVPAGVVGRVFDLDPAILREALSTVRVRHYGTDDLQEYADQLQWDAIEHSRDILAHGSESDKMKLTNAVLGKHIALAGRRTPQSQLKVQEGLTDMLREMREGTHGKPSNEGEPFIVRVNDGADA